MILAIDPGKVKCGLAVLGKEKAVIKREELLPKVQQLIIKYNIDKIVIGDSAAGREIKKELARFQLGIEIVFVSEKNSTREARQLYWQDNPPEGLWRLIPTSLRFPPRPIDDYAAQVLAERANNPCLKN